MRGRFPLSKLDRRTCLRPGITGAISLAWRPGLRTSVCGIVVLAILASPLGLPAALGQQAKKKQPAAEAEPKDAPSPSDANNEGDSDTARGAEKTGSPAAPKFTRQDMLIASLTIFLLAIFVGFEVITKVPPTLHTPLMSGSNAISGITIVGALIVAGKYASFLAFVAVILATINVVGGFLVTHRMLAMFKKR